MGSWMPSVFGPATWVLICLAPLGMARPIQAEELSPRIVLDLKERQIRFVSEQGNLGPWPVAIGDPSTPTPKGRFRILDKQIDPINLSTKNGDPQELSGPLSPIGDRYLAFFRNERGEFGIHGTPWPHWVKNRAAVSQGCVRMLNDHMRQLFDVVEVGTPLEISD